MKRVRNPWEHPGFEILWEMNIPFHDLDPMEVVWHGNYFQYLEQAREALLKQLGYGYKEMHLSGYMWPVVDAQIKYRQALTFDQKIGVKAVLQEFENRLKIAYEIINLTSNKVTTIAYTIQVAIDAQTRELCLESPLIFREKIQRLLAGEAP